ncbi:MAG: DoxX family protein [Actinomycetota bacterium]
MIKLILTLASAGMFMFYGYETLFTLPLREEFERYRLPQTRVFVGWMQVVGAVGVLAGLQYHTVGGLAAGGLTLMMLLGLLVRFRLRDTVRLMVPAAALATINAVLVAIHLS